MRAKKACLLTAVTLSAAAQAAPADERAVIAGLKDCVMSRDLLAVGSESLPDAAPQEPQVRSVWLKPGAKGFVIGLRLPQPRTATMRDRYVPASVSLDSDYKPRNAAPIQLRLQQALRQICLPYAQGRLLRAEAARQIGRRAIGYGVIKLPKP